MNNLLVLLISCSPAFRFDKLTFLFALFFKKNFGYMKTKVFQIFLFLEIMLPKKLEWSVLAQCDYFAVEKFVQTTDRPAMTPIQPLRESIFLRKIKSDLKWKETFETLCQSYKDLAPTFAIEHDNFGG